MNNFLSKLYEMFGSGYVERFSDDLYRMDVYSNTALYSTIITLCSIMIMYYVYFNWLRTTNSTAAWLIWAVATAMICAAVAYSVGRSALYENYAEQNQDLPYDSIKFIKFSVINAFWVFLLCWVLSILLKGGSPHGKGTPHLWPSKKTKSKNDIH